MSSCPTCGQPILRSLEREAKRILYLLAEAADRDIYRAQNGSGWYITNNREGPFSTEAVRLLVDAGHVHSCYSNCPHEAYHLGPTIDIERTLERRKREGKHAPIVHVDAALLGERG